MGCLYSGLSYSQGVIYKGLIIPVGKMIQMIRLFRGAALSHNQTVTVWENYK